MTITRCFPSIRKLRRALMTTLFDGAGESRLRPPGCLCAGLKRTGLSPRKDRRKSLTRQCLCLCRQENRYWCAPRTGKTQRFQRFKRGMSGCLNLGRFWRVQQVGQKAGTL